jgi:MinD superfamily P-loop ATPase
VIEATKHADFVVLVTEPTPFGLHDLTLAVETMRKLEKDFGVVINKANLGDRKVYEYCEEEELTILMELPQDERIARVYSQGELPAKLIPDIQPLFRELYEKIERRGK